MHIITNSLIAALLLCCASGTGSLAQTSAATTTASQPQVAKGTVVGAVRTAAGKPVANARVWVVASFFTNSPAFFTLSGQTDAAGNYRIAGLPHLTKGKNNTVDVAVYAKKDGYPVGLTSFSNTTGSATAPVLILPEQSATFAVHAVDSNNTPVAGLTVEVAPDDSPDTQFGRNHNSNEWAALMRARHPRAVTDSSGVAFFAMLSPDTYRVVTTKDPRKLDHIDLGYIDLVTRKAPAVTRSTDHRVQIDKKNEAVIRIQD